MVSARPPPNPARGRVAYPSATNYTPGDADAPTYTGSSEPVRRHSSREAEHQGLKTWWKGFRERSDDSDQTHPQGAGPGHGRGVFGEPLAESIQYASVQISTAGDKGALYVWGVVPVVVAKCGLYLKENATEVEGTFRISGSAKRMRELQAVFDGPPKYGKDIDWKPYTEHDVATIFRRFLTQMPEPTIPIEFYEDFRSTILQEISEEEAVEQYKTLIRAMPPINQYLLLYVLDLLNVFAKNSDKNLMTTPNLALIFQPGMLSHPAHAMRPSEHVLSQRVLEFLIEKQDHFLVGMDLKQRKKSSPREPSPPKMTKAEADFMVPSDSDEDVPSGGYYIVESKPRAMSSTSSTKSPPPEPHASLIPNPPSASRPRAMTDTRRPSKLSDVMEPSDSDEDAPPGGYEVRESDPAERRAALLAKIKPKAGPPVSASGTGVIPTQGASGLNRRSTLPARIGGRGLGTRKSNKEV